MKWIKNSDRQPSDKNIVFIVYSLYKDVAYYEDGVWYNAITDQPLLKAFTNNLFWLDESVDVINK
ncbi:MAG: hypothetical protein ABIP68_06730 [Ferruginibacter sp.]